MATGLTWEAMAEGPYAVLRIRYFREYPLIEDNSARAESASLVNLSAGWRSGKAAVGLTVLNLFDANGAAIQYFYASRLVGEPAEGVEGVDFHPVECRQVRVSVSWGL